MRKTKVLFIWNTKEPLRKYFKDSLKDYPETELIFPPDTEPDTLIKYAPEIDIIIGWRPPPGLLDAAGKLGLYNATGVGAQHLIEPFRELNKQRPVILCNSHGNAYLTAQHAVAILLTLTNKVVIHHNRMVDGIWRPDKDETYSTPFRGRTIGLLGYGAINRNVHRFLAGFDLKFAVLKRDWNTERPTPPTVIDKYEFADLHRFLSDIDTLVVAVPLTSITKGMIGKTELDLLGPDGLLVNVARGPIIDEESLYTALKEKIIAGAAIDVWYEYHPDPYDDGRKYPTAYPFHELDNVVLSPHRAASPFDDPQRWDDIIENIKRFADCKTEFLNVMNLEHEY
ncbi:MAG: NAD(P)-dependent oxidoreductase [candidate division Zixibacteria bacterium]